MFFSYISSNAAAGAVSLKSIFSNVPSLLLTSMNPPPPRPLLESALVSRRRTAVVLPVVHADDTNAENGSHQAVGRVSALFEDVDSNVGAY